MFKLLPHLLTVQLKRFDMDWESMQRVKLHDYIEIPQELDMEEFVTGLF